MILLLFLIGVYVFLIWNHHYWQADTWPEGGLKIPEYQAHRGFWRGGSRENSLEAFRAARVQGAMMIELDVRLSLDGKVIVFHDANLQRLYQNNATIGSLSAADLKSKFQIPTLEEVLSDPQAPSMVNIEIKSAAYFNAALERETIAVIRRTKSEGRVLMSSFNPLSLRRFYKLAPQIPRALLATREKAPGNKIYLSHLWLAPYVHPHLLHLDYRDVSAKMLEGFKKRKIPVALWTVNDRVQGQAFLNAGVVSLISDELLKAQL